MRVDIQTANESAQASVENQLLQDASDLSKSISDRIHSLMEQSEQMAKELSFYIDQAKEDSLLLLGEEENIFKINENLTNTKIKLDNLINTKESDISQQMSEIMVRITALQNRTLGMQIKDEVKSHIDNVIEVSRNTVKTASEKFTEFFKSARAFVKDSISKIKENVNSIYKVASECLDEKKINSKIDDILYAKQRSSSDVINHDYLNEDGRYRFEKSKISYMEADRQNTLDSLTEKYKSSKGVEKLMYKIEISRTEHALARINVVDAGEETFHNWTLKMNSEMSRGLDRVRELAEDTNNYLIGAKEDLARSAKGLRDSVVTSVISKLDSLSNKAKSYAEEKGIDLSKPDKEESMETNEMDEKCNLF